MSPPQGLCSGPGLGSAFRNRIRARDRPSAGVIRAGNFKLYGNNLLSESLFWNFRLNNSALLGFGM